MTGSPLGFGATTASQDSTIPSGWMAWPGPGNHSINLNQSLNWDAPGSNLPGHRHPPRVAEEKNWPALLILVVIILTVGGNILVILAVSLEKKLQNATNFFLSSLAVADMLVGILVMPISLINILYDYVWPLPNALCPIWIYLDVLFSTSSIMHLCAISLDRYLGIRNPIKHSRFNSRTKAMLKIGAVWTISIVISMPIPVIGLHDEDKVFVNGSCVLNEGRFVLVGSFMAFFIPLVIMVTTYCLTVQVLQRQATDFLDKSGAPSSRHRCSPTPEGKPSQNFLTPKDISVIPSCPETTPQYSSRGGWRDSGGYEKRGMMQAIKNERRASKVLGVVFFLFLVMWCPFFITNVMNVLCRGACNGLLLEELLNIFVWVGYISSGVNPLVYTLFNKTYRHAFSQYMHCRYQPARCKAPLNHRSCVPSPAATFTLLCGKEALDRNSNCRNGSSNPLSSQDLDDMDERLEMQPGTSEVSVNSCCRPAEHTSCM